MDLRLNARRRSINLSVYLVFDLEAGRFKFSLDKTYAELRSTQMTSVVNLTCKQEINYSHLHSQMSKIFAAKLGRSFTCAISESALL